MPRGHFSISFDKASGFNCLQGGAAGMGWQGDVRLSCATELLPMAQDILTCPTALVPQASASPAFPSVPLD